MAKKKVYALYGIMTHGEPVLMFFRKKKHRREFAEHLPGRYHKMTLVGIGYDDFEVK